MIDQGKALVVDGGLAILYAVAAVSGALGGCTVSCYYITHDKTPRWAFAVVYIIIGLIFGALTFAGLEAIDHPFGSAHHIVLYSAAGGTIAAVVMASLNLTVKMIFKHLGIELQVTLRRPNEERRDTGDTA